MNGASIVILVGSVVDIVGYLLLTGTYVSQLVNREQRLFRVDDAFVAFLILATITKILATMVGYLGYGHAAKSNPALQASYAAPYITDTVEGVVAWLTLVLALSLLWKNRKKKQPISSAAVTYASLGAAIILPLLWVTLVLTAPLQQDASNVIYAATVLALQMASMGFAVYSATVKGEPFSKYRVIFFALVLVANVINFSGEAWILAANETTTYDDAVWWIRSSNALATAILAAVILAFLRPSSSAVDAT